MCSYRYSGEGNENIKKQWVLMNKTTTHHVFHNFWDISLSPLHDYDVKYLDFTLYRERKHKTVIFVFFFATQIIFKN